MAIRNPYHHIVGIGEPGLFFNRTTDFEQIFDDLSSAECISIVGQRKIGKTSLVQHLMRSATIQRFSPIKHDYLFVYVNCQMHPRALDNIDAFYRLLVRSLRTEIAQKKLGIVLDNKEVELGSWQDEWENILLELMDREIYVITIFDEFDKAIMKENLIKDGLFGSLRAYGHHSRFAWITCTNRSLHRLFQDAFDSFAIPEAVRRAESDFFNIVPGDHIVGLFEQKDIEQLITVPLKDSGITFSAEDKQVIERFGGRFPYYIRRACNHIFNEITKGGRVDHEAILQQCLKEVTPLWTDYWNKLDPKLQGILFAIASNDQPEATPIELEMLKDASLIYKDTGKWRPFSEEFGRFVVSREHPYTGTTVQVGQLLWDQYQVLKIAGHTSHSLVVKAWDTALNRYIAIKYLHSDQNLSGKLADRLRHNLLREGRILLDLENIPGHKNIGKMYHATTQPPAIFMQWIEGWSLQELLQEGTDWPIADVLKLGMGLAEALEQIHAKGITHRDIKPNNILLNKGEEPVLIDFDIARSISIDTITQGDDGKFIYVGNPRYSAPEQFLSPETVDTPADIFSLGVVLYEILTHQIPFVWGNNPERYPGHYLPTPERDDIPEQLFSLLCDMLSQETEKRPTAPQLKERLQACFDTMGGDHANKN
jgi:tRNA A-37 threonylcarbamoyl transferase component Bud32